MFFKFSHKNSSKMSSLVMFIRFIVLGSKGCSFGWSDFLVKSGMESWNRGGEAGSSRGG